MDQVVRVKRWTWSGDHLLTVNDRCCVLIYTNVLNPTCGGWAGVALGTLAFPAQLGFLFSPWSSYRAIGLP